jgi:hypothetical protein
MGRPLLLRFHRALQRSRVQRLSDEMDDVCLALRLEILPSQRQEMEVSISFADRAHCSSINRLEIELADFSGGVRVRDIKTAAIKRTLRMPLKTTESPRHFSRLFCGARKVRFGETVVARSPR